MRDLTTIAGSPVSRLGLGGTPDMEPGCVRATWDAGVNWFFFYNLSFDGLIEPLGDLARQHRDDLIIATGTEARDVAAVEDVFAQSLRRLGVDTVDVFFVEYLNPKDDVDALLAQGGLFDLLSEWRRNGRIRYVGATCHDRDLAVRLTTDSRVDVLMHRYNMAHRGAEEKALPAAEVAGVPVIAFTATRWGTLLEGHAQWQGAVPSAADCYRYALAHPAVRLAMTAPRTVKQLEQNLTALTAPTPSAVQLDSWRSYGSLVYGKGADAFDTDWP
ncbi:MAG: aldo/keto reductase [Candidatus Latescibacteria bacterium]|jgi:aryl-alcohol dehydrogenase-like predicted oxidoreductase|nr:aldo/keto reductase [Candidatus Latescibacterota bacterium]HJP29114.1 aldo/keto reductase [Candidatus Latescibacterota bacterium]